MDFKLVVEALEYEKKGNGVVNDWTEVEIEGNDAVTSMSPEGIRCIGFKGQMIVTREEAALVFYALGEYKQRLTETVSSTNAGIEDEVFCYDILSQIAKMQFDMTEDHTPETKRIIQTWLDTV